MLLFPGDRETGLVQSVDSIEDHEQKEPSTPSAYSQKRTLASSLLLVFRQPHPHQLFSFGNLGGGHALGNFIPVI